MMSEYNLVRWMPRQLIESDKMYRHSEKGDINNEINRGVICKQIVCNFVILD